MRLVSFLSLLDVSKRRVTFEPFRVTPFQFVLLLGALASIADFMMLMAPRLIVLCIFYRILMRSLTSSRQYKIRLGSTCLFCIKAVPANLQIFDPYTEPGQVPYGAVQVADWVD